MALLYGGQDSQQHALLVEVEEAGEYGVHQNHHLPVLGEPVQRGDPHPQLKVALVLEDPAHLLLLAVHDVVEHLEDPHVQRCVILLEGLFYELEQFAAGQCHDHRVVGVQHLAYRLDEELVRRAVEICAAFDQLLVDAGVLLVDVSDVVLVAVLSQRQHSQNGQTTLLLVRAKHVVDNLVNMAVLHDIEAFGEGIGQHPDCVGASAPLYGALLQCLQRLADGLPVLLIALFDVSCMLQKTQKLSTEFRKAFEILVRMAHDELIHILDDLGRERLWLGHADVPKKADNI